MVPSHNQIGYKEDAKVEDKFRKSDQLARGPDPDEEEATAGRGGGAMSKDPEAVAVMEMMGKTFISKDVKAADDNDAKQLKDDN